VDFFEATEFIIRELGKFQSRDVLIMMLCEKSGYKWYEAEDFIHIVEQEHGHRFRKHQLLALVILEAPIVVGIALVGLWFLFQGIYSFLHKVTVPLTFYSGFVEVTYPNGGQYLSIFAGFLILGCAIILIRVTVLMLIDLMKYVYND